LVIHKFDIILLILYIGKPALVCAEGTQQLIQQHDDKVQRTCHLCGERPGNWRTHISTHILRSIRGLKEVLRAVVCDSLKFLLV
jgi:hypothetical protein